MLTSESGWVPKSIIALNAVAGLLPLMTSAIEVTEAANTRAAIGAMICGMIRDQSSRPIFIAAPPGSARR
jgi:hypothetical protein